MYYFSLVVGYLVDVLIVVGVFFEMIMEIFGVIVLLVVDVILGESIMVLV